MKKQLILFSLLLLSTGLFAQNLTVTGTVTDPANDALIGATVREVGNLNNGTITNFDGQFTLKVANGAILEISYVGFSTQRLAASNSPMVIALKEDAAMLDEVVVTGYTGTQVRSRSTNSIAKVDNKKMSTGVFSNPGQALSGAVSGLRVTQSSGNPGSTPQIVLRGGTNLDGSGAPLVIIDGQIRGGLNDINPEDIEDMQVMKDAGATAIYGARANNGVILITTKKGKSGHSEINFKSKVGINFLNNPYQFADAETYLTYMRKSYVNSSGVWTDASGKRYGFANINGLTGATPFGTGNIYYDRNGNIITGNTSNTIWGVMYLNDQNKGLLNKGWKQMKDPIYDFMKSTYPTNPNIGEYLIFNDINPSEYNFKNPSYSQDYNVNMSGGNDKGNYYAGIGYNHSQGLPISSYYKRYSFLLQN